MMLLQEGSRRQVQEYCTVQCRQWRWLACYAGTWGQDEGGTSTVDRLLVRGQSANTVSVR